MKKTVLFIMLFLSLNSCNSKIDYTLENLSQDEDLKFIVQNSEYLSGYHDYDNNIIGFDLKLLIANEDYYKMIVEKATVDNWKIVHNDGTIIILYKIIDNKPVMIKLSKESQFVSVKIE
ncbi:hypothetical protein D3C80_1304310 [compost metagenome]